MRRCVTSCTAPMYSSRPSVSRLACAIACTYFTDPSGISNRWEYSKSAPLARARVDAFVHQRHVIGMDAAIDPSDRHRGARLKLEDAIELFRPRDVVASPPSRKSCRSS